MAESHGASHMEAVLSGIFRVTTRTKETPYIQVVFCLWDPPQCVQQERVLQGHRQSCTFKN